MSLELIRKNVNLSQVLCDEKKRFLVEGEVTVPDIKPDMLNLVHVYADSFITEQEILDGRVKVEGTADTYLIYLADDDNNSIRSITYPFRFTEYIETPGITENSVVAIKCQIVGIDAKIISNRKVNLKISGLLQLMCIKPQESELIEDVVDTGNIECQKGSIRYTSLVEHNSDVAHVNETISLEDYPPIGEVLKASIKLIDNDYKTSYHKILAKTEAVVRMVYTADDESSSIQCFEAKIPVAGFIDLEKLEDSMKIVLENSVKRFSVKPVYQDMKATSFIVESDILFDASVYQNVECNVVQDLYGLAQVMVPLEEKIRVFENEVLVNDTISMTQTLMIPDLDRMKVLDIEVNSTTSNVEIMDGKIALEGNLNFSALYYRMDRKTLETKRMELPFRQVVKADGLKNWMTPKIELNVKALEYKLIGQNELQIEVLMDVNVSDYQNKEQTVIQNVEMSEESIPKRSSYIVYFVKTGDSLWSIAKKYHVSLEQVKVVNELKEDTIYPGQQLVIPQYRIEEVSVS